MSGSKPSGTGLEALRFRRARILWLAIAGSLFLLSFLVQLAAVLQRWVVPAGARGPRGLLIENHRYDYYFPVENWVPLGTTAQLFGLALLLQAIGVLAMAAGVMFLPDPTVDHLRSVGIAAAACEALLAVLFAASFAVIGSHALVSGLTGAASGMPDATGLSWGVLLAGVVPPLILAAMWRARLPAAGAACVFLLGTGFAGYLAAIYVISPLLALKAYDARWAESVQAASTGAAAVAMAVGALFLARRTVPVA
ncbi:hypothetical protein GCM10009715_25520 [Paeniglutamicibacter psychrophenolicus]|uniref:DUF998 domain-containing protein n=1 Tax=Paeniglutamicibacter psychrophenolicus TaxID=257454 RepID=A0ABS4WE63_9MICC|nr:hypothetical protein [Paeniglutamicibacter psychrophenolicus]MBP2374505.1 hypothetical protein [Paeniglutamicibacter psychrophenolicus]